MEISNEERVLVLAPTAADAALSRSILGEAGLVCHVCVDLTELCREIDHGLGVILLSDDAPYGDPEQLIQTLRRQPAWSDIPTLFLSAAGTHSVKAAWAMENLGNVTVLDRPARLTTLVSALRSAIRARRRQYELRDQIAALQRSENNLNDFFENAATGLHWVGPDGIILRANQTELNLLGYTREEYVGHHISEFHADENVIGSILQRLYGGETVSEQEARLRCKDGSIKHVLITSNVLWEDGRFVHTRCFTRDITPRKRAEEALRDSEERLRLAISAGRVGVWDWNIVQKTVSWSDTLFEIHGVSRDEFTGDFDAFQKQLHPDDVAMVLEAVQRAVDDDAPYEQEFRTVRPDGEIRWIFTNARVVRDPTGNPLRMLGAVVDITERKRAEEAVRRSEARLAAELETMTRLHRLVARLVAAPDLKTALGEVLNASIQLSGADFGAVRLYDPRARVLEMTAQRGFSEEYVTRFRRVRAEETTFFDRLLRGQRVVVKDFAEDPVPQLHREAAAVAGYRAVQSTPLIARTGFLRGILSTHFRGPYRLTEHEEQILDLYARQAADLWEHLHSQDTLRRSAIRLSLLWEAATVLLTTDDPHSMLRTLYTKIAPHFGLDVYFNFTVNETGDALRLESCFGIPDEEVRKFDRLEFGQAVCGTVALHRQPIVATHIQQSEDPKVQLVKGYGIRAYACNPLVAEGRLLGTLSFASRQRDDFEPDEIEFLETIARYVTVAYERVRFIRQLRENDRRKDEFLATLAHELRNPLAPIHNSLQIMRLTGDNRKAAEEARSVIEGQLGQMVRLIDDLLDVNRISRGKLELRKERVDLISVVKQAVDTARPYIEASGHELTVRMSPGPVYLEGDPVRLAQVLSNLLNNAAKYMPRGGHVWLTAALRGNEAELSVRDAGIGIPQEALSSIFEMFTQLDRSLEKSNGGLGIGLTLVKQLVELHGGSVEARSEGTNKGAEFVVRLPILTAPELAEQPSLPDNGHALAAKRRILVADDYRDAAESMGKMLRLMGHEVRTVRDGLQAVDEANVFRPDVILLDIGMPRMNGYNAARHIRQQPWAKNTVLVALTGWGQEEDKRRATEAGFDLHFTKPVNFGELEEVLARLRAEPKSPEPTLAPG